MALTVWIFVLSLVQLFWLVAVWRRSGFLAALGLFIYGSISAVVIVLYDLRDGPFVP